MYADVILPLNLPRCLTYGVPHELQGAIVPGMRVEVNLGANKQIAGIVERLHDNKPEDYVVKPIRALIDDVPVVHEKQLQFWRWIGQYYMAAPGEVMHAALPAHLKMAAETRLEWSLPQEVWVQWTIEAQEVVEALQSRKEMTLSEVRNLIGPRHFGAVLNELLENEAVTINDSLESDYRPRRETIVALHSSYSGEPALMQLFQKLEKAPKQLELLMAFLELQMKQGVVKRQELLERAGGTPAVVKQMADKGIFRLEERQVDRLATGKAEDTREIVFTDAQIVAGNALTASLTDKNVALLHGVTGSGKTHIYIQKIRECLATGKQAIMLLPEIGLTTHLVSRLQAYFGGELGVYHSHFTNNERVEIWEKVRKGQYKVVAGPRSVLWLPYISLGIIIVDEEHDGSYKQKDPAPRFHARDAAIYLAGLFGAKIILGSATPSVESLYNVQTGKYAYVAIRDRYQGVQMPAIEIVDSRSLETVKQQGIKLITPELQVAMAQAMDAGKQVILFQNRRGYSPFQLCTACGWVPQCRNCSVSLTYHKATDKMHCHYCGLKAPVPRACPQCGNTRIIGKSFGTEKIEEEVQQLFPKARVARMDVDSMKGRNSMAELLAKLEKRKVDVLVGTQMVVKGLDFASVSIVGIVSADSLLSFPDFRVNERAFQLMEQVSGRAGRSDGNGRVLIQVHNVKHPVLAFVQAHDVHAFYIHEIRFREHFLYPPFSRLVRIIFRHSEEAKATEAANIMAEALKTVDNIVVQGPGPAVVARVRNQYHFEIWIKVPREGSVAANLKAFLWRQRPVILAMKGLSNVQVIFDVDPV